MLVTVIIPTYNYAQWLPAAIESVWNQDYPTNQIELIVVDDGSTDNTRQVVEVLQQKHAVIYHYKTNSGKAVASQRGIELATGEIIFMLDADDWMLPGKIAETVRIFNEYPAVVHVASPAQLVWQSGIRNPVAEKIPVEWIGQPLNGTDLLQQFYRSNQLFGGGSTFAARASVLKTISWSPGIDMYTDEWLIIATLLLGDSFFLPTPLSVWRIHGQNFSDTTADSAAKAAKIARLSESSAALLQQLQTGDYPQWLQKVYGLKHRVRLIAWQEQLGSKRFSAILSFFGSVILSGHSLAVLKAYHAFNRLLPMGVLRWLKGNR